MVDNKFLSNKISKLIATGMLLFLFSCNYFVQKDKFPEVLTVEDLLKNNKLQVVERKDSTAIQSFYILNDSIFISKKQFKIELKNNNKEVDYKIMNSLTIKNFRNNKVYFSAKISSSDSLFIDKQNDIIISNQIVKAPDYKTQLAFDQNNNKEFFKLDSIGTILNNKLVEVDQFSKRILYKLDNGKLPNPRYIYYYTLGDLKFKSKRDQCFYIDKAKKYIYHPKYGILKTP